MIAPGPGEALYLFYVAKAELSADAEGSAIGGPDSVLVHRYADFACVLGMVSIGDFCGPEAERNLNDLGWVGERALRHQRVIERGFQRAAVLPARFGTLFSSLPALERFIDANRVTIAGFLDRVQDREEWGLKALLERAAASKWLSAQMAAGASSSEAIASPGLRYLQQRRSEAAAEKQLRKWLLGACESVARSLDDYAIERRQRQIFDAAIPDDSRETVLNLAALIPRPRRADFIAHLGNINAERAKQGLSFVLNGPWPPYSFCPPLVTPP